MYDDMDIKQETNQSQIDDKDDNVRSKPKKGTEVNIRESLASTNLLDGR
jgi:hypothetical protein